MVFSHGFEGAFNFRFLQLGCYCVVFKDRKHHLVTMLDVFFVFLSHHVMADLVNALLRERHHFMILWKLNMSYIEYRVNFISQKSYLCV